MASPFQIVLLLARWMLLTRR